MLLQAIQADICDGIYADEKSMNLQLPLCWICGMAKSKRQSLKRTSRRPAELPSVGSKLVIDIQGPMQTASFAGNTYCVLGVDVASDMTFFSEIVSKDEALTAVKRWFSAEYQARGHTLRIIKSDNDSVMASEAFTSFFNSNGVTLNFSQAYNPEQNSLIEKRFHHIDDLARANLNQYQQIHKMDKPPLKIWGYAMRYAIYILSKIRPSKFDPSISAEEAFTSHRPSVEFAVPFGTIGITSTRDVISKSKIRKLDARGFIGIFVGCSKDHQPGYIMMTKERPVMFYVCRNTRFDFLRNEISAFDAQKHHDAFDDPARVSEIVPCLSTEYVEADVPVATASTDAIPDRHDEGNRLMYY